jgi:hypothetical protein
MNVGKIRTNLMVRRLTKQWRSALWHDWARISFPEPWIVHQNKNQKRPCVPSMKRFTWHFRPSSWPCSEICLDVNLACNVKLFLVKSIFMCLFVYFSSAVNMLFVYWHVCLCISLHFCLVSHYCAGLARVQLPATSMTSRDECRNVRAAFPHSTHNICSFL